MKIAIYHNLPSGGAKRSLFELVTRTKDMNEYTLYRPNVPDNETYLDLKPHVQATKTFGSRMKGSMLAGGNFVQRRKDYTKFLKLEQEIAQAINESDCDVVFMMSCMFTHSPGLIEYLTKPVVYYLQEPRRSSFEYSLSPLMQAIGSHAGAASGLKILLRQAVGLSLISRDMRSVRAAHKVLCNSYFSHESIMRSYGVNAETCYLGMSQQTFAGQADNTGNTPSVVMVGAVCENKNQQLLLEAVASLPEADRPRVDCIYDRADEDYLAAMKRYATEYDLKVHFSYRLTDTQLAEKYAQATAVVCLAELEPFGFTPLEANAAGTPVVALREGGYRETVRDGETGVFCDAVPSSVAAALQHVARKDWKSNELARYAATWSWDNTVEQYLSALESVQHGS